MTKFIKVYDENGGYAINPQDCPISVDAKSLIVCDLNGDITICKHHMRNLFGIPDRNLICDLKNGTLLHFNFKYLFMYDPKYGIIKNPSYSSMKECFLSWDEEDYNEPCGYGTATDLLTLDRQILIDFLQKVLDYANNSAPNKDKLNLALQDCFGQYYSHIDSEILSNFSVEDLVYFILQCENYSVTDFTFSIQELEIHGIFKHKYLLSCGCHKFSQNDCNHAQI